MLSFGRMVERQSDPPKGEPAARRGVGSTRLKSCEASLILFIASFLFSLIPTMPLVRAAPRGEIRGGVFSYAITGALGRRAAQSSESEKYCIDSVFHSYLLFLSFPAFPSPVKSGAQSGPGQLRKDGRPKPVMYRLSNTEDYVKVAQSLLPFFSSGCNMRIIGKQSARPRKPVPPAA